MSQHWTNNARPASILQCKGATSDVLIWLQYFVLVQYPEICVVYVGTPAAASSLTFCLVRWLRIFVSYVSDCLAASSHMCLTVLLQACDRELTLIILVPLHFGFPPASAFSSRSVETFLFIACPLSTAHPHMK